MTSDNSLTNLAALPVYLQTYIVPFIENLKKDTSCCEHLEYAGCGSIVTVNRSRTELEKAFLKNYGGLFSKGFDQEKLDKEIENHTDYPELFINCLHDSSLLQVNAVNVSILNEKCENQKIPALIKQKVTNLFTSTLMSAQEVKDYIIKVTSEVEPLFDLWENTKLSRLDLTTVGIAIAQANFRRKTGMKLDLSNWVK